MAMAALPVRLQLTVHPVHPTHTARPAQRPRVPMALGLLGGLLQGLRAPQVLCRGRNYETNIRKKKGPAERKLAKLTAKHLRLIVMAMKEGGPDPAVNSMLNRNIRAALKDNIPRDTIDRRIKAFSEKKEAFEEVEVQGYGPGGAAVVIEAMTDNMRPGRSREKVLRRLLESYWAHILGPIGL